MTKDPNKSKKDIIVTSEGNFSKKALALLNLLRRNNQEIEDVVNDAQREYLCNLAKDGTNEEEIEEGRNAFYLITRLLRSLRKK
jgi:hypothetical protein